MASLADAEEALRSTSAKANFQRLTRLLMCGGLKLLRETFDSILSPADLPLKLGDPTIKGELKKAKPSRPEWDCLYPSPGVYGKSTDFDITLIFRLLRTICNLTPPPGPRGWDDLPNSSDHSLEADLVRIKYYRNKVYGHRETMEITDTEFNDLWGKISEALIRIAARISREKEDEWKKSIADFLHSELTPEEERYNEELKMWYMQDMDVKSEVANLREELKTHMSHMSDFKEEVAKRPAIIVVNTIKSVTQAGLQIIVNYPSGRPQIHHESGESRQICALPASNQEGAEEDVSNSGELQLNPQDTPTEIEIWSVIISFKESFELFLKYLRYKLNLFVRKHDVSSLLITVECSTLQILQGLWKDYRSGHLNDIAQEILVTAEVLEKLGLDEVRLKTFISEDEYENCKQIFKDISAIQPFFEGLRMEDFENQIVKSRIVGSPSNVMMATDHPFEQRLNLQRERVSRNERDTEKTLKVHPFEQRSNLPREIVEVSGGVEVTEKILKVDPFEQKSNLQREIVEVRGGVEVTETTLKVDPFEQKSNPQREIVEVSRGVEVTEKTLKGAIEIIEEPSYQKIKEGSKVELVFKCKARGNSKLTYQWYKDGAELQGKDEGTLVLNSVTLPDFGWYKCVASCKDSSHSVESPLAELDVIPRDGTKYKCLREIDMNTQDRIESLLTQKRYGLGGWRAIASKYGMHPREIYFLENDPEAGRITFDFLRSTKQDLTVYDFCKTLKEHSIRRLDIVQELLRHLSVPSSPKQTRA